MGVINIIIGILWKSENTLIKSRIKYDELEIKIGNLIWLMLLGFFTGLACVCLGLGAGTITNPILIGFLDYYAPSVISATSVFLMTIVAFFASYVYYMTDQLNLEYAFILSNFAMLGCILILSLMRHILFQSKDESIIIYILITLILISTVLLVTSGIIDLINSDNNKLFSFGSLCFNLLNKK